MKHFSRARGRLANLPLAARVVYSVFLGFTLAGLAMSAWLTHDMVGLGLSRLAAYYAGAPSTPEPAARDAATGGPRMDLPPELDTPAIAEPMPMRKLLEVTHFHLFSMPLYLLVLSHLFMLSALGERAKVAWITTGTLAVAGHIAAPWLVRSGAAGSAAVYAVTGTALALSFGAMAGVALFDMWAPGRPPGAAGDATA